MWSGLLFGRLGCGAGVEILAEFTLLAGRVNHMHCIHFVPHSEKSWRMWCVVNCDGFCYYSTLLDACNFIVELDSAWSGTISDLLHVWIPTHVIYLLIGILELKIIRNFH